MATKRAGKKKSTYKGASPKKAASSKKPAAAAPKTSARAVLAAASKAETPIKERLWAIAQLPGAICADSKSFQTAIRLLTNTEEPIKVRLAALQALQAASFSVISFASCQSEYTDALHTVMEDPDPEMRQRVLGILSRQKDPTAGQRLLDGIRNPDEALVPVEKALQLLANDIHTEAYSVAREIVANPPNPVAKREALRLLASDATSVPLLEKVLRDKDEYADVRQVSAAALNTLNPEILQKHAREMVMDEKEYPEIQATSLTALGQFAAAEVAGDEKLRKRIDKLTESDSAPLRTSAQQYISGKQNR